MKSQPAYILLSLIVLLSCKTSQNLPFTKSKKEKRVFLTDVPAPHVLFVLESGDTLKFSSRDFSSLLDEQARKQIKIQGYLSDQSWRDIADILKNRNSDTLVFQTLSSVDSKTISGILDMWVARELLLKGKSVVALKNWVDNPQRLKYIFTKDNLGGQQGTFYTEDGKLLYLTIIALGE